MQINTEFCLNCHIKLALADTNKCHHCGKNPRIKQEPAKQERLTNEQLNCRIRNRVDFDMMTAERMVIQ